MKVISWISDGIIWFVGRIIDLTVIPIVKLIELLRFVPIGTVERIRQKIVNFFKDIIGKKIYSDIFKI